MLYFWLLDINNLYLQWFYLSYKSTYTSVNYPVILTTKPIHFNYQLDANDNYPNGINWTTIIDKVGIQGANFSTRNGNKLIETMPGYGLIIGY